MARPTGSVDAFIDGYVSPPDDPAGRAQALSTLKAWHAGIEAKDLAGLESLMHENIVIELPLDPGLVSSAESVTTTCCWSVSMVRVRVTRWMTPGAT